MYTRAYMAHVCVDVYESLLPSLVLLTVIQGKQKCCSCLSAAAMVVATGKGLSTGTDGGKRSCVGADPRK